MRKHTFELKRTNDALLVCLLTRSIVEGDGCRAICLLCGYRALCVRKMAITK